ncbi:MAG: 30S ribosomal protein S3 [Nitrospirota bacterium]
MGQKVHPIGFRLKYIYDWESRWFAKKSYTHDLIEDLKIRKFVKARLKRTGVSKIIIERFGQKMRLTIYTARPGMVIGRGGQDVEKLRNEIQKMTKFQIQIDINEIKEPELDAQLVAENVAVQLERRIAFRRAMKQAVVTALRHGAKGIKISCGGRLGGAEIARTEWYREGRVPLQTLRAEIDYGMTEAATTYGRIGIKVWIFKGEILSGEEREKARLMGLGTQLMEEEKHVNA